jgi:hypothetical protein
LADRFALAAEEVRFQNNNILRSVWNSHPDTARWLVAHFGLEEDGRRLCTRLLA